jgi:hypothetical protein
MVEPPNTGDVNMASTNLALTFTHPRGDKTYEADVGHDLTVDELVTNLVGVGFLDPAPDNRVYSFSVKRTGATIPPKTTLEAAGVTNGDTLVTTLVGGAGGFGHV